MTCSNAKNTGGLLIWWAKQDTSERFCMHDGKVDLAHCEGLRERIGIPKLAPHDLRRTCARLCHASGGELEQIQFLLGHVSVQSTERYLGCKQRIRSAVNDRIGIELNS